MLQLQNLGVQPGTITFTNVTMESDKYICVRETGAQNQLVGAAAGAGVCGGEAAGNVFWMAEALAS